MNTITLYRIKTGSNNGNLHHRHNYRVSQTFRMLTSKCVLIPKDYALNGVALDPKYTEWFEEVVFPLMSHHMGDRVIEKWAVPSCEDPEHVTIALCVNNILIAPDLLHNTTSYQDSMDVCREVANAIYTAVQQYEQQHIHLPVQVIHD